MSVGAHVMKIKLIQLSLPKILPFHFILPKFILAVLVGTHGKEQLKVLLLLFGLIKYRMTSPFFLRFVYLKFCAELYHAVLEEGFLVGLVKIFRRS